MKKSLITVLLLTLYGCGGGGGETDTPPTPVEPIPVEPKSYSLTGNFEKGPFIVGSVITIQEFDDNLVSTGKTFNTETINNVGNYNIDLSLTDDLVEVSADGYYFNEISGQLSNSKLRLSALANASDNENININILTHLSKKRIKTLVSDGKDFSVAKKQAEEEVQELFSFVSADWEINDFDRMGISEYGDNNSYLLLVSAIIQNINMSTSELSEYIERLAQDLSDNGIVNDNTLVESINLSAQTVNLSIVRTNLTTRYDELGETLNLPDFELLLNRQPIANAGEDLTGSVGVEITLDGSRSTDIDNDSLTYNWSLIESPEGSVATLTEANLISPSLTPDIAGNYQVSLTVSDAELISDADVVNISTNNRAPVAIAGEDFSILVGESINLDASNSYDIDGDTLTYQWTSLTDGVSVNGTGVVFDAGVIPPPTVLDNRWDTPEPILPSVTFNLSVTDSHGSSVEDNITVTYTANLLDNNDGTVSDGFGNMWEQGESEVFSIADDTWDSFHHERALGHCGTLIIGQYDDWRAPLKSELFRLVNIEVGSPTIDTNFFPAATSHIYITTSRISQSSMSAINFDNASYGYYGDEVKTRCIR